MCGIAGYSLAPHSRLDRTLAAQALLAAVAERGTDAVGYAFPAPSGASGPAVVVKQQTPASRLLEHVTVPAGANEALVHVRDFTKGHPSVAANNHPIRHGPVVGVHNGRIENDDALLAAHACARSEPSMTVDSARAQAWTASSSSSFSIRPLCTPTTGPCRIGWLLAATDGWPLVKSRTCTSASFVPAGTVTCSRSLEAGVCCLTTTADPVAPLGAGYA